MLLLPLQFLVLRSGTPSVLVLLQSMQVKSTHDLQHVTFAPAAHPVCIVVTMTHHAIVSKPICNLPMGMLMKLMRHCLCQRYSGSPRLHEHAGAGPSGASNMLVLTPESRCLQQAVAAGHRHLSLLVAWL